MKILKCPSCGAKLNSDGLVCEYCGSVFEKENPYQDNFKMVRPILYTNDIVDLIKSFTKTKSKSTIMVKIFICLFTIFWCAINIYFTTRIMNIMILAPITMMLFGLCVLIPILFSHGHNTYLRWIKIALQQNNINNAYIQAKTYSYKRNEVLAFSVIIAFYLKDDMDYVLSHIKAINYTTYSILNSNSNALANIYQYLNIPEPVNTAVNTDMLNK